MKTAMPRFLIAVLIVCFGSVKNAQAVSPPPDGGYSGNNTAEGQDALLSLTTGIGEYALFSNTVSSQNTAVGDLALYNNTTGNANVAIGALALSINFTGGGNTALGEQALSANQSGNYNIAIGFAAAENTTGSNNILIVNCWKSSHIRSVKSVGAWAGSEPSISGSSDLNS